DLKRYGTLQNYKNVGSGYQIYKRYDNDDKILYRRYRDETWGDWKTIADTGYVESLINDINLSNYTQKDKEETIEKKWEFEKNIKIPKATNPDEAVNLEQLDEKANLDDIKDGKFEVEGVGALEGSGTMTANQENDTNAELDLTQDTKDNIQKGIDAYDELNLKDYLEEIETENTNSV